jgi:hypothetical protein
MEKPREIKRIIVGCGFAPAQEKARPSSDSGRGGPVEDCPDLREGPEAGFQDIR